MSGPILPTVTGFAAKQAVDALRRRGIAPEPFLQATGLDEGDVADPHRRVPATAQAKLLELAAEAAGDTAFGLHIAEESNPRQAGLLFYASSSARTFGEALTLFARYARIANESARVKLERRPDGAALSVNHVGLSRLRARQAIEFQFAATVKGFRDVAGWSINPAKVQYAHARNADVKDFERFFGCPVEFGAPVDEMLFAPDKLALPLYTADENLLETLRPFCEEAAKLRATAKGTLRDTVENEVQRLLPHGEAQADRIAKTLAMSGRTLSRRLAEEGTNFAEVVDEMRRTLALQYVREPGLSLAEISWLLGYEGATSFNHAFRRWFARSPSEARAEATPLESALS
jgi:AraC-like DNA-binding protein